MQSEILEQLYICYYKSAFLYCLSLCNNRELAEDIVADAFVQAYLSLSDEQSSFQYWLLRVSKNLWLDYLRRQKRKVAYNETSLSLAYGETPEESLLQDERSAMLYRCIRQLPTVEREILILHYFSNLSLKEIAGILNASPGSIKTRIFRARQKLKKLMEESGYGI